MMGILNHSQSDDGIFWMPIEDFIKEYKSLYMCVVFDQRWKKFGPIAHQWTEENSMAFSLDNVMISSIKLSI